MNAGMDTYEKEEDKISKINSAGLINITTEGLWKDVYNAMSKGDFLTWNRKLDAIWLILSGDVVEGDVAEKKIDAIDDLLYSKGSLNVVTKGFKKSGQTDSTNRNMQYLILKRKAIFLRRLQNGQGKGTAYKSTDEADFD